MDIKDVAAKVSKVSQNYSKNTSIKRDDDWYVLKLQEEVGELMQSYLMLTKRGRQKGKTADEIREEFEGEVADVLGQILLVAENNSIDVVKALEKKWFKYL